jgi:hypothetical protein
VRETERAAERLNVAFLDSGARNLDGLEERFSMLSKQRPEALLVAAEPFTRLHRDRILDFTIKNRIPAINEDSGFVWAGGLISYGPNIPSPFHSAAGYVDSGDALTHQRTRHGAVQRVRSVTLPDQWNYLAVPVVVVVPVAVVAPRRSSRRSCRPVRRSSRRPCRPARRS